MDIANSIGLLIKAVQELEQENKEQKEEINNLKMRLDKCQTTTIMEQI
jgi:cell division septum initiation protein DivIVA